MNTWYWPLLITILAPALLLAGAWGQHLWSEKQAHAHRHVPAHWPLSVRPVMNSEEVRVWHWLSRAFYDHHVLIKLPVTRFTLPREQAQGMHWYRMLGSVYCTFTVCSSDGRVVGCIDVPGAKPIPRPTRHVKHSLFTQCGLPYWVVKSSNLPTVTEIRAEFLGETPDAVMLREREAEERSVIAANTNLRMALEKRRKTRGSEFDPVSDWASLESQRRTALPSQWQDNNSFLSPLDSRLGNMDPDIPR